MHHSLCYTSRGALAGMRKKEERERRGREREKRSERKREKKTDRKRESERDRQQHRERERQNQCRCVLVICLLRYNNYTRSIP